MNVQKARNDVWYDYAQGMDPPAIAGRRGLSLIWVRHRLTEMVRQGPYLQAAHLRNKRSKYRKTRFVFSCREDRWMEV